MKIINFIKKIYVQITGWKRVMPTNLKKGDVEPFLVFYEDGKADYNESRFLKIPVFALAAYEKSLVTLLRDVHCRQELISKEMVYRETVQRDADSLTEATNRVKSNIIKVPGSAIPPRFKKGN